MNKKCPHPETGLSRRELLRQAGIGFGSLALSALLAEQSTAATSGVHSLTAREPHFAPRAKRIIFLFMRGGPSQVDTFDPKPRLQRDDGKPQPFDRPRLQFHRTGNLLASPWKFKPYGQSGIQVSELFPHLARCVDDLCIINSLYGTNPEHGLAISKLHTGSETFIRPCMGSWILYGLGTENQNLPGFISICPSLFDGGVRNFGSAFLPAFYQGTPIGHAGIDSRQAKIEHIANSHVTPTLQRLQLNYLRQLNSDRQLGRPSDPVLEARIESFELAFSMQSAIPDIQSIADESPHTLSLYGLDHEETADFGYQCLLARRFAERGVRFIQCTHQKGSEHWDQHGHLLSRHPENARQVDKPIAGLLADLKQRGLLDDTLVLWGGEFGRTPVAEPNPKGPAASGRDHNPEGFTMWLAGGGVKQGLRYGATDDYGYYAVENKVHIHDLHATLLHLLGLDHTKLTYRYAGRDFRLTDVYGNVVHDILA